MLSQCSFKKLEMSELLPGYFMTIPDVKLIWFQEIRTCGKFHILTSKWASRHNCPHFFDISTAKSAPKLKCFVHVVLDLEIFVSRHNGVHVVNISTSKSAPRMVCFGTFYFQMCFTPQRRAICHFSSAQMSPHPPL